MRPAGNRLEWAPPPVATDPETLSRIASEDGPVDVLVAPMVSGNRELIAGVVRDPQFGPSVMLGVGGILAEAVADVVSERRRAAGAPPPQDRLADAYAALGVTPQSSAAEIKRAYRKLISQNHPDKLAARGLPESMRAVAEERSREINSAYDLIKAARSDLK